MKSLAKGYLQRVQENLEKGNYKEAIEDVTETERMNHDYDKKEINLAKVILKQAKKARQSEIGMAV